jgi:hypothetical protein
MIWVLKGSLFTLMLYCGAIVLASCVTRLKIVRVHLTLRQTQLRLRSR